MPKPHPLLLLHIPPPTPLPQPLPPPHENPKQQHLCHSHKRRQQKRVLKAHVGHPWRDTIANGKGHRVPDQHDGDHGFAAEGAVAVDGVGDGELGADRVGGGEEAFADDEAWPGDVVVGTYALER